MLAHRLALALGMTVEEINNTMTVSEFMRWQAFYEMFPWGHDDLNFGRLLHLLASIYSKKGHTPNLKDFLIGQPPTVTPDPLEVEARLMGREYDDDED